MLVWKCKPNQLIDFVYRKNQEHYALNFFEYNYVEPISLNLNHYYYNVF